MDLIYLDHNCFQRGFDDPRQIRIQMEALACQEIFLRAERDRIGLVWSFMHQDETILCPFPERKYEVLRLNTLCKVRIGPDEEIHKLALSFQKERRLSAKDAIHLACAFYSKADFFLTCDDQLMKQAKQLKLAIRVMNPVDYIREVIV
jgi:predicted nucleic acid-binding protein